ncbi:MAG: RNA-binding protein, partial [Syntrophorhabdaceae bacterium]|nr:RNA-binding protein [Syntrophorhabdaceae bacterium]
MIVFVKKIHQSVTPEEIEELFKKYGAIKIDIKENIQKGEKFAFIEIPDEKKALEALKRLDGYEIKGKAIKVKIKDEKEQQEVATPQTTSKNPTPKKEKENKKEIFPYGFFTRKPKKEPLSQFHDELLPAHYDIAFEITWETLTPTASNPVLDENESPCFPPNDNGEFTGYNRRWLTIDGHLAISPFTVKS